jgi:hypothetical protein
MEISDDDLGNLIDGDRDKALTWARIMVAGLCMRDTFLIAPVKSLEEEQAAIHQVITTVQVTPGEPSLKVYTVQLMERWLDLVNKAMDVEKSPYFLLFIRASTSSLSHIAAGTDYEENLQFANEVLFHVDRYREDAHSFLATMDEKETELDFSELMWDNAEVMEGFSSLHLGILAERVRANNTLSLLDKIEAVTKSAVDLLGTADRL